MTPLYNDVYKNKYNQIEKCAVISNQVGVFSIISIRNDTTSLHQYNNIN